MSLVVLSPHLDDAIMSFGGTMHLLARLSISVRIVTLFAGDPGQQGPPSWWDEKRGAQKASEAFAERRAEDAAAAAALGVETIWLPFNDDSYSDTRDGDEIWSAVQPHLQDASAVLAPGAPLAHADHEYTATLALERIDSVAPLLFYAEQPYASRPRYLGGYLKGRTPTQLENRVGGSLAWTSINLSAPERKAKTVAVGCYEGELVNLGYRRHWDSFISTLLRQERIAHRPDAPGPSILVGGG